jgi:hypothetical protein
MAANCASECSASPGPLVRDIFFIKQFMHCGVRDLLCFRPCVWTSWACQRAASLFSPLGRLTGGRDSCNRILGSVLATIGVWTRYQGAKACNRCDSFVMSPSGLRARATHYRAVKLVRPFFLHRNFCSSTLGTKHSRKVAPCFLQRLLAESKPKSHSQFPI